MDQRLLLLNNAGTLRVDRRHLSRQGYSIKIGGSGTSTNVLTPPLMPNYSINPLGNTPRPKIWEPPHLHLVHWP